MAEEGGGMGREPPDFRGIYRRLRGQGVPPVAALGRTLREAFADCDIPGSEFDAFVLDNVAVAENYQRLWPDGIDHYNRGRLSGIALGMTLSRWYQGLGGNGVGESD